MSQFESNEQYTGERTQPRYAAAPAAADGAYVDIVQFLRVVLRNLWLILIIVVIGTGIAYLMIEAQTPIFESRASVAVLPNVSGTSTIPRPIENMNIALGTYVQVMRSQTLHDNVRTMLAGAYPDEQLSRVQTQVQPIENSSIITVVVQSADATLAKSFAAEMINQVIDDNPLPLFQLAYRVHLLDSPNLPDRPVVPNKPVSLALGVAGSLLIALAAAFLFDTWRRRRRL